MAFDDNLQRTEDHLAATEIISNTNTEGNQVLITIQAPVGFLEQHAAITRMTQSMPDSGENPEQTASQSPNNDEFPEISNNDQIAATIDKDKVQFYQNDITGKMQLIAGNVGVESGYQSAFNGRAKIHDNKVGADAKVVAGDVGGLAAIAAMTDFFK